MTTTYPPVPLPAGVEEANDWQPQHPGDHPLDFYRIISGSNRRVEGLEGHATIYTYARQLVDGTIGDGNRVGAPEVHVEVENGFTSAQARELAAAIVAAADEVDRWVNA